MEKKEPRAYLLYCKVKLAEDQENFLNYYIGVPEKREDLKDAQWVYTIARKNALRFKDNQMIGKFISLNIKALKNIQAPFWERAIYIEDVDHEGVIVDFADLSKF